MRLRVLRKHDAVAGALDAQLIREFREVSCARQVDDGIWEQRVAVAAPDDREAEAFRQWQHEAVLCPAAISVQLECVNPFLKSAQKGEQHRIVAQLTDIGEIPIWMIEDDECLGALACQSSSSSSLRVAPTGGPAVYDARARIIPSTD